MKKSFLSLLGLGLIAFTFGLQSCNDNDDWNNGRMFPSALVTVKPNVDNSSFYLQLDDITTLAPTNMTTSPFGKKEVRALVNYTEVEKPENTAHSRAVKINWIDSILTKPTATSFGKNLNIEKYGNDPVEIINDWVTIAEDGYLTLRFRTRWGYGVKHYVNLVITPDETNAYNVTLYHNAKGDKDGQAGDALVAFRLSDLSDTQGKTVNLKLNWMSFSGEKSATFKYCTRKSTNTKNSIAEGNFINNVQ